MINIKQKGITLVETLVVITIFSLVMSVIFGAIISILRSHNYAYQESKAVEEARRGVETMVREIRAARTGDDGSYPIEKAGDKEFVFYSDINKDGRTERVRYFLGSTNSKSETKECVTFEKGGSCSVVFSDFLEGNLISARVEVSVEGDFGWRKEYADIYADGNLLTSLCKSGCSDCSGNWQDVSTFDVTNYAGDGEIEFLADSSSRVDPYCDWVDENHSMKVKFKLYIEEEIPSEENKLKKGVIEPTSSPIQYPSNEEKVSILTSYVRNSPPIFEYFDSNGEKIIETPAKLSDTKLMKIFLIINVDPNKSPQDFKLESYSQLRNLKDNY